MAVKRDRRKTLNFNVGVLGHIDSGKTSLAKALSTLASTASFDKNPQSRERGITLDLGFSSFSIPAPIHLGGKGYDQVQFTLVDCPGHASLIRTIIGGAQIIDLMLLVVDITKGIQTQTAECLVIGEVTCDHMIVVLNKVDLIEDSKREAQIAKVSKRLSRTLETTRFSGAPIVPVAAKPGGPEAPETIVALGIDKLIEVLAQHVFLPSRSADGPFIFSVDHCFAIRGQGTVMTGTVLSGNVGINDAIEIPFLKVTKKVKSIQMFKEPVQSAKQGDRVGICVTQFDPKQVERCLVCSPGHLPTLYGGVVRVHKVPYHKSPCNTGAKCHITIGHETVMAKTTFFGSVLSGRETNEFDFSSDYPFQEQLLDSSGERVGKGMGDSRNLERSLENMVLLSLIQDGTMSCTGANGGNDGDSVIPKSTSQFALLEFERPIACPTHSLVIGSRLDADASFHGRLLEPLTDRDFHRSVLPRVKIFKLKSKEGTVDRIQDERTVIGKGLFKKETKLQAFLGLRVQLSTGELGTIEGAFGTSGKFRVNVPDGLKAETMQAFGGSKKKGRAKAEAAPSPDDVRESIRITLNFKRYCFDPDKLMIQ